MGKKITDYQSLPGYQTKTIPTFVKEINEDQGIVQHYISIFGIVDDGFDIVEPNSFVKTLSEHGTRVKVLDQHRTDSALRVVGKPLQIMEVGREMLPADLLARYPEATGGVLATTQYADTDNGRDMFKLIKGGFLPETSIGYDALDVDYEDREIDGVNRTIRRLKTVRLWEYSNVIWGMNSATTTLLAKELNAEQKATEIAFHVWTKNENGKQRYQVLNVDEDTLLVQSASGEQFKASYSVDDESVIFAPVDEWEKQETEPQDDNDAADLLTANKDRALEKANNDVEEEKQETQEQEQKIGRAISAANAARIQRAIDAAQSALGELENLLGIETQEDEPEPDEDMSKSSNTPIEGTDDTVVEDVAQDDVESDNQAGPDDEPPTSEDKDAILADIESALRELDKLSEVEGK